MKKQSLILLGSALAVTGNLLAEEVKGYQDSPIIPGTPYHVHDGKRPQPRVVKTAGAVEIKAPEDATVLFDGKNLDAWVAKGGEKAAEWEIKDGVMVAQKSDIQTKENLGAVQLHLEWRLPEGRAVDGQGGGNSGCIFMGRYEVQILQSHNNKTYPDGQAGSLYGQFPPLVNVTSPQGEWNSYDITFVPPVFKDGKVETPAKAVVIHNGVVVQNGESLLGPTQHRQLATYAKEHPETGPLVLQFHGDPVEFRNIWVRPLGEHDQED